ncbi:MAG: hypothetical protein SFY32_16765 [Bacteroidota bacterium]|nr:hypothetical protein [Bacteroidota bacterium]
MNTLHIALIGILILVFIIFGLIIYIQMLTNVKKEQRSDHPVSLSFVILIAVIFIMIPVMILLFNNFSGKSNEWGDTIGGITAPFMAALNAVLVYMAFQQQLKANEFLRNIEQRKIISDRFAFLLKEYFNSNDIDVQHNRLSSMSNKIGKEMIHDYEKFETDFRFLIRYLTYTIELIIENGKSDLMNEFKNIFFTYYTKKLVLYMSTISWFYRNVVVDEETKKTLLFYEKDTREKYESLNKICKFYE